MKRNISFALLGMLIGLATGFKTANYTFRREKSEAVSASAAQAASRLSQASSVNSSSSPEKLPEQGQQIINEVRAIIDKARSRPQDFDAQREAANQFIQIQRPEGALEFLLRANQIKPDDIDTMADLSEAYYFKQQFDESVKWARQTLGQRPGYPLAMFYLMASLIEEKQNLDEAAQLLARLEALKPGDPALAQVRQSLEGMTGKGATPQSKSVLSHGPEESGAAKGTTR
jgi:tetratricopeptide (TPR) repeat protein